MDNKININKSQNNIVRVTSNNVQQLEKQAESYANSADKSRQDCANYLALVQRVLQECVSVKNEINVSYVSDLTDHVEDDNNPHKVTAEQVNSYTKSEVDDLLQNIDVTVDGVSASNLYVKDEVDDLLSLKSDKADVYTKTEIDNKHYLTKHQDISGKVDKVTGKGLSTEDYTTAEKDKLAGLSNYNDSAVLLAIKKKADINHTHSEYLTEHQDISGKVDKVTGKGLSTEDYTTVEKNKLAGLSNYDDTEILSALSGKADVNHTHSQYLTEHQDISGKVDKVTGKGLSTEDYTTAEKNKLAGLSNYDDTQIIEALDGKADVNHTHSQYLTEHQDLSGKADISDIPTKTSDLTNDSGFLTSHQDISGKVDKVIGKGLSTNDYTTAEKNKLAGLSNYDDTQIIEALDGKADVNHTHSQYLTEHQDISGKVDKVTGKGLSTEDYTTAEKNKLAGLSNYDDTQIIETLDGKADVNHTHSQYLTEHQDISGKVDKVTGKGLSTEDYTTAEKTKLAGLSNYDDTEILSALSGKADVNHTHSQYLTEHQDISGKVDKVIGKGLSTEDYTTAEKTKLAGLSNYDDTEILSALDGKADVNHTHNQYLTEHQDISGKVDKVTGKGLSTNDFTDSYKNKLDNLEENISIPTKTSDLTNDSGFLTEDSIYIATYNSTTFSEVETALSNGKNIFCKYVVSTYVTYYLPIVNKQNGAFHFSITDDNYNLTLILYRNRWSKNEDTLLRSSDISDKENKSNKVTSLSSSSTDSQYPSAKCVYNLIGNIETLLSEV